MGVYIAGCAKEKDLAYEEEAQADGWKGIEGRNIREQMFCLWTCQEGSFTLPVLCKRWACSKLSSHLRVLTEITEIQNMFKGKAQKTTSDKPVDTIQYISWIAAGSAGMNVGLHQMVSA